MKFINIDQICIFIKELICYHLSGGAPTTQWGFLGCLRALSINGMTFDLQERAKMTPGMNSGCPGHCSSESLCHNGGRCLENRNSYICDCTHTAFTGANCKTGESCSVLVKRGFGFGLYLVLEYIMLYKFGLEMKLTVSLCKILYLELS